jgi:hypothetical protein
VAWQVVDESYTSFDDYEKRGDSGTLQSLSRSKYLDYVKANHGWFEDLIGDESFPIVRHGYVSQSHNLAVTLVDHVDRAVIHFLQRYRRAFSATLDWIILAVKFCIKRLSGFPRHCQAVWRTFVGDQHFFLGIVHFLHPPSCGNLVRSGWNCGNANLYLIYFPDGSTHEIQQYEGGAWKSVDSTYILYDPSTYTTTLKGGTRLIFGQSQSIMRYLICGMFLDEHFHFICMKW